MIVAVDFDGTIVENAFPGIGNEIPYAVDTLKYIVSLGHKIILHTCRTNKEIDGHRPLEEAVEWCKKHGVELYAVNDNPVDRMKYGAQTKVSADLYIDDRGYNMCLVDNHVDWISIKKYFRLIELRKLYNETA
jgi:hypothetical protein